ncbi:MAG: AI-2E family transporter [Fibrobacteria bacterium]|nr:AI-2E family transporter [Fibrobacteria bacterium]
MKSQSYLNVLITGVILMGLLYIGKKLLIPFVLAVFIWYLINVLTEVYKKIPLGKFKLPASVSFILSIISIFVVITVLIQLITDNISDVVKLAPEYQKNLMKVFGQIFNLLHLEEPITFRQIMGNLKIGAILSQFAKALTGMMGNAGIIFIYLIFLFLEQKSISNKLNVFVASSEKGKDIFDIIRKIDSDTRLYIGIKTITSATTAILSYILLSAVGLDFAEFWAIMIFVFNYIPTVGSIVATIFPAVLALVQFPYFYPFFIITGGLVTVQFLIGSVLEPRLMGNKLNLSPLAILLSLTLWGSLWGVAGMILCVPIMVIAMIVLSHFPKTLPIAMLLSRDGKISQLKK